MLVSSHLSHSFLYSQNFSPYIQLVIIHLTCSDFYIVTIYRSPSANHSDFCNTITFLENLPFIHSNKIIILGDLNFPGIDWSKSCVCPRRSSPSARLFLNFCVTLSFSQIVKNPTHLYNIIDIVLTSAPNEIANLSVSTPFSTSDHASVKFNIESSIVIKKKSKSFLDFGNADFDKIISIFASIDWRQVFDSFSSVELCYTHFVEFCQAVIHDFVPLITQKQRTVTLPLQIQRAKTLAHYFFHNRHRGLNLYSKAARKLKRLLRRNRLITEDKVAAANNPKKFYQFINSNLKLKQGIGDILGPNSRNLSSDNEKAEAFALHFESVYKRPPSSSTSPTFPMRSNTNINYILFTEETVFRMLSKLPLRVSTSPDKVPYMFLKKASLGLTSPLFYIYQRILLTGEIPSLWKTAIIRPVYKKGAKNDASNYRPISLTSGISKLFERIVAKNLVSYLLTNKLLSDSQHGFLPRKSTTTSLLSSVSAWQQATNAGSYVSACFIDFSNAFDTVTHSFLLSKLSAYGISGCLLNFLSSFVTDRTQCVMVNDVLSRKYKVPSGVPQGSVLGPILFLLYINDVSDIIPHSVSSNMYADDIKIYSINNPLVLQEAIDRVHSWSLVWNMNINIKKTVTMAIGRTHPDVYFLLNNNRLDMVDKFKDLGVTYDNFLSFDCHIDSVISRAFSMSNFILKTFVTRNIYTLFRLFTSYVRPLLEFNCEVWNPSQISQIRKIESVQKRFTKRILCRIGQTDLSYSRRLTMLNTYPLETRRISAGLCFMYKMIISEVDIDFHDFFQISHRLSQHRHPFFIIQQLVRLESHRNSFTNKYVKFWNSFHSDIFLSNKSSSFRFKTVVCLRNNPLFRECLNF